MDAVDAGHNTQNTSNRIFQETLRLLEASRQVVSRSFSGSLLLSSLCHYRRTIFLSFMLLCGLTQNSRSFEFVSLTCCCLCPGLAPGDDIFFISTCCRVGALEFLPASPTVYLFINNSLIIFFDSLQKS